MFNRTVGELFDPETGMSAEELLGWRAFWHAESDLAEHAAKELKPGG